MENQVTIKNCEIKVGNKNFKIIDGVLIQTVENKKAGQNILAAGVATLIAFLLFGEKVALYSATQYVAENISNILL